jgi:hypothetical protein
MKVLYLPFKVAGRQIGTRLGKTAFDQIWSTVGETQAPPSPASGRRSLVAVAGTAALEAAILAGIGAVVEQLTARAFHNLLGAWPENPPEPS